jgi:hypothetical protein
VMSEIDEEAKIREELELNRLREKVELEGE